MLLIGPLTLSPSSPGGPAGAGGPTHWRWALSRDGQRIDTHGQASDADLDRLDPGGDCVLVVPAGWLSWHRIRLPAGRAAHQAEVLRHLVEDHVLDDPSTLHVALQPLAGPSREPQTVWCAVCRRERLAAALEPLLARGWPVSAVVPEAAPAPEPLVWAHRVEGTPYLTWMGPDGVLSQPLAGLVRDLPPLAPGLLAWAEPDVQAEAEQHVPELAWTLGSSAALALRHHARGWNLAQFEWRRRVGGSMWQRLGRRAWAVWHDPAWRPARWGLAALIGLPALALPALAWQQHRHEAALRAALLEAARQALPNTPILLDPARQVAQALARERLRTGDAPPSALERLLHAWGSADGLPALQSLSWDGQRLDIGASAAVPLPTLQALLGPQGWEVEALGEQRWRVRPTAEAWP
ncbi:MAG: type II secretion system protein GspL [Pseudomonadota bacterium]